MSHPALWRATLLAAAVHLHRQQPRIESVSLVRQLQFKSETMMALNQCFAVHEDGRGPDVSDEALISVLVLIYFMVSR